MSVDFTTPEGRIVQGDLFKPQTTNFDGKPLTDRNGQPAKKWFFALAIPKAQAAELVQVAQQVAQQDFPGGEYNQPTFSWKLLDGDKSPDKEGFAGCWVLRVSSGFPIRVYDSNNIEIVNPDLVKRGYYARAHVRIVGNGDKRKPGLFINPHMVRIERVGEEIVSGPSASEVFGPGVPGGVGGPGVPGGVGGPGVPGGVGGPGVPGGVGGPGVPGGPMPPPKPEVLDPPLTPAAGAWTYSQYKKAGWTDAQLIAAGYMAATTGTDVPF